MGDLLLINLKYVYKVCPLLRIQFFNSEPTIYIKEKNLLDILLFFKNHTLFQFKLLTCISGVDYPNQKKRFKLVYELLSLRYNSRIRVKLAVDELSPIDSSCNLFLSAGWYECEVWDMFGVFFSNHPSLKRILTDYGFEGHPLRKDFPLSGFTEVRYNELKKRVVNESLEFSQEYRTFDFISPWSSL